jgi:hypothetical protein
MTDLNHLFEYSIQDDPPLDFCLWEYPAQAPPDGKFRSINLLYHSFAVAGAGERVIDLCKDIRKAIGDWRTVWGVKYVDGQLSWEFYFYDYARDLRSVSVTQLIEVLGKYADCDLDINEDCLYFMFSIDIDEQLLSGSNRLNEINIYIGNPGSMVSSGISYLLTPNGMVLDNLYYFFDAVHQMQDIRDKITSSVHIRPGLLDMDSVLWPELKDCETIVVANKKENDGIYFSRIDIDQLLVFLQRLNYPDPVTEFIRSNRDRLDHLLYDVGVDYKMVNGELQLLKSSYYGIF